MTSLTPVSFRKGRASKPRLSAPYVPGKRHQRFWTEAEDEIIRSHYPRDGMAACAARLPSHHATRSAVYNRARHLGLSSQNAGGGKHSAINPPPDIDAIIRSEWALLDGRKKGEVGALADRLNLPRWWITKRAIKLGLVIPHKKEPPWTAVENDLMSKVPLHDPPAAARIFREHGFARSETAIIVRAKRLSLSRRATREELSARKVAAILGVDDKMVTGWCISGDLKAAKRADRRLPQQGGSSWDVRPEDLRRFVIDHLERIDLRKVEKFAFVHLLTGEVGA